MIIAEIQDNSTTKSLGNSESRNIMEQLATMTIKLKTAGITIEVMIF